MITPNKFTPFEESTLSKIPILLHNLPKATQISELYAATEKHFSGIDQFMYTIDVLYALDRIQLGDDGMVQKC